MTGPEQPLDDARQPPDDARQPPPGYDGGRQGYYLPAQPGYYGPSPSGNHPAQQGYSAPGQPDYHLPAPQPYVPLPVVSPPKPKAKRRPFLASLGVLALIGAGGTGAKAFQIYSSSHSPARAVERYFEAVASGDAVAALGFASKIPSGNYLTNEVLEQQLAIAKVTDVNVHTVRATASSADVEVSYNLRFKSSGQSERDRVRLVKSNDRWLIVNPAATVRAVAVGAGSDRLMFAGRPMKEVATSMFPGALPVTTDNPNVIVDDEPLVTLSSSGKLVQVTVSLGESAKQTFAAAVDEGLAACLNGTTPDPRCPVPDVKRPVPGSLRGATTTKFASGDGAVGLDPEGKGLLEMAGTATVTGTWKTWNFNNQIVAGKGKTDVSVHARAAIDNPGTIYWITE